MRSLYNGVTWVHQIGTSTTTSGLQTAQDQEWPTEGETHRLAAVAEAETSHQQKIDFINGKEAKEAKAKARAKGKARKARAEARGKEQT